MKIKLTEENKSKIESILNEVQKRSKVRTITFDNIMNSAIKAISRINYLLPANAQKDIKAVIDSNAEDFPNAYKGQPESTIVSIQKFSSGWFLVDVKRCYTHSKNQETCFMNVTDEQKAVIANRMLQYKNW